MAPQDIFFIVLAIVFALVGIALTIALIYIVLILRDFNVVSTNTRKVSDRVNKFMIAPAKGLGKFIDFVEPIYHIVTNKKKSSRKKK